MTGRDNWWQQMTGKDKWWHQMTDKGNWWQQMIRSGGCNPDVVGSRARWQRLGRPRSNWRGWLQSDREDSDGNMSYARFQMEEGDCNLIERELRWEYLLCWITLMSNLNIYSICWHIRSWDQHISNKKSLQLFRQYNFEKWIYCDSLYWRDLIVLRTDRLPATLIVWLPTFSCFSSCSSLNSKGCDSIPSHPSLYKLLSS